MVESAQRDFIARCGLPDDEFYADSFTSEADKHGRFGLEPRAPYVRPEWGRRFAVAQCGFAAPSLATSPCPIVKLRLRFMERSPGDLTW